VDGDGKCQNGTFQCGFLRRGRKRERFGGLSKIKMRLPSPGQVAGAYWGSDFHQKNFKQPLVSRARQEDDDVARERKLLVENSTPGELAKLSSPFDIPLPKLRSSSNKAAKTSQERKKEDQDDDSPNKFYATLPRAMKEKNVVTAVKEDLSPEEAEERRATVQSYTPAELGKIKGLGDIPVPSRISGAFKRKKSASKKRSRSETSVDGAMAEDRGWYDTLPKSLRENKMVTKVKEADADDVVIQERMKLVESTKPSELGAIRGPGDLPIPRLFKARSRSGSVSEKRNKRRASDASRAASRAESLPRPGGKSWRDTKCVTKVKASEADDETIQDRRRLVEAATPAELGQITSVADLPIPTLFKKRRAKDQDENEDARSPSRMKVEDMYSNLPRSLKTECLVRTKTADDEETLRERRQLVETRKPGELGQIHGLGDFPVPSALEGIYRPRPKAPKRNKEKDAEKRE